MADKSFGIKELNLISSGTPKIESPNNLNLSAVTVAISTNATVGGTLDVDGHTELDDVNISGISTFAGITTVTGQTLFTKQLGVSGFSTFFNDVKFVGTNYDALWDADEDRLEFKDGASAVFGTGNDLEIKHSGGNTSLTNVTGEFRIAGNDIRIQNEESSTDFIKINSTGSVVTGILTATNVSASSSITAATFYGNGANLTGLPSGGISNVVEDTSPQLGGDLDLNSKKITGTGNISMTGIATATGFRSSTTTGDGSDVAFAIKYYITSSGSSAYRFAGAGVLNSSNNPTLYFQRGFTYILENSTGGSHPFELRVTSGGSAYAPGGQFLTGSTTGTQILTVPMDAPASIVYQCTIHGGMVGTINFVQ